MERESFKSRTGFLLVSAGCAIGIGNVWRFPYVVGQNGGGLFVLFYLIFLVLMGIPVLTMEFAVGRASGKSAVLSYKTLEKPKSKWHIHGWFCMLETVVFAKGVVVAAVGAVLFVALYVVIVCVIGEPQPVPPGNAFPNSLYGGVLPNGFPLQLAKIGVARLAHTAHL